MKAEKSYLHTPINVIKPFKEVNLGNNSNETCKVLIILIEDWDPIKWF